MCYFLIQILLQDIYSNLISVFLVFFNDNCTNKQLLLECCFWRSEALSTLPIFVFKPFIVFFTPAISRSFSLRFALNSLNFLFINSIALFFFFTLGVPIIWVLIAVVEIRCIPSSRYVVYSEI